VSSISFFAKKFFFVQKQHKKNRERDSKRGIEKKKGKEKGSREREGKKGRKRRKGKRKGKRRKEENQLNPGKWKERGEGKEGRNRGGRIAGEGEKK
jgi:hypothetical protein